MAVIKFGKRARKAMKKLDRASGYDKKQDKKIKKLMTKVDAGTFVLDAVVASTRLNALNLDPLCLNPMNVGGQNNQRLGTNVSIYNFKMNLQLFNDRNAGTLAAGPASTCVRVFIVYDKQCNGQTTGLLNVPGNYIINNGTNTLNFLGLPNWENRRRFRILHDKTYECRPEPATYANPALTTIEYGTAKTPGQGIIKIRKRFKRPLNIRFNTGTGGTITDIESGAILMFMWPETINTCVYKANYQFNYMP